MILKLLKSLIDVGFQVHISRKKAKQYIEQYLEQYSGIKQFMDDVVDTPKEEVPDVFDVECEVVEIDRPFSKPEFKTCEFRNSSFEVVYVDPCLEKVTRDGVKASQEKCSLDHIQPLRYFESL